MSRVGQIVPWLAGFAVWIAAAVPAHSQSNLDAGKSAAQIFATTCSNCHRSPREIRRTTASFMREHYTTGSQEASAMAAYLASAGSDPRAIEQRRRPTMGAGQGGPSEASAKPNQAGESGKPSEAQAALGRPRRPAESVEVGVPMAAVGASPPPAQSAAAAPAAGVPAAIEE